MTDFPIIDFTGGINYRDTSTNLGADSKKVHWLEAKNVRPYKNFGATRMGGNNDILQGGFSDGFLAVGTGRSVNGEFCCVATDNGDFLEVDVNGGVAGTPLVAGLSATEKGRFVKLDQSLLYSNGTDEPFYYYKTRATSTTGTVTINGTINVVGIGTLFIQELLVGDTITIAGETRIIDTIADNLNLTVRTAFSGSTGGVSLTRGLISYLNSVRSGVEIRGKAIAFHANRIYTAVGNTLYWSALGIYNEWTTSGATGAGFYADFGSVIKAIEPFKEYLLIHLENDQTFTLSGGVDASLFAFNLFFDKSSKSPFGLLTVENEQYFVDDGVFTTAQVGELNQIRLTSDKAAVINPEDSGFLDGDFDAARQDEIFMIHNKVRKEIWFYLPIVGVDNFKTVYIYDYGTKQWFLREVPQDLVDATIFEDKVYAVTVDGEFLREDLGSTFNGTNISWFLCTQFFNFGKISKTKDIDELWMTLDSRITNKFKYSFRFDYDTTTSSPEFQLEEFDPDNLIWDEGNWDEKDWAINLEFTQFAYIYNGRKSIQLCLSGDDLTENMAMIGLDFRGVVANEV